MKRLGHHIFANLFSSKGSIEKVETSKEVFTTWAAQPHVLQEKMKEKKLSHGETVTATISPVRLETAWGKMALYFCPMQTLDIAETITPGDGGDIPIGRCGRRTHSSTWAQIRIVYDEKCKVKFEWDYSGDSHC